MRRRILIAAAWLLLCSVAIADGPLYGIWQIQGYGYQWQRSQQLAGYPLELGIRLVKYRQVAGRMDDLEADAAVLQQFDRQPIVLRMDNIPGELDLTLPRVKPTTWDNFRQSHNCVKLQPDGTLDTSPLLSPWAVTDAWSRTGTLWGGNAWMQRLQEIIPKPTSIILRENNELQRVTIEHCYERQWVYLANGKRAQPGDAPAAYATPVGPEWFYRVEEGKVRGYRWRTDAELDTTVDLRAKEWVGPRRSSAPYDPQHETDLKALDRANHQTLFASMRVSFPNEHWRDVPFRTVGYGGFQETHQHDTASGPLYIGNNSAKVLTAPVFRDRVTAYLADAETNEARNDAAWREQSVAINRIPVFEGARLGLHAAIDPESYAGYMTHVAWRLQAQGVEVRLIGWERYLTSPDQRLLVDSDAAVLATIGRPELLQVTIGDYDVALLRKLARIHDHPTLERYWREGTTQWIDSPLNTATQVKVYATETTVPGSQQTLLTVYSLCDLTGEIPVGAWTVPAKRFAYYLTGSVQEIE